MKNTSPLSIGLLALVACGPRVSGSSAACPTQDVPPHLDAVWLHFKGSSSPDGDRYILSDADGAQISVAKADVRIQGDDVQVKAGATIKSEEFPAATTSMSSDAACIRPASDGSAPVACIGFIKVLCASRQAVGFCLDLHKCN